MMLIFAGMGVLLLLSGVEISFILPYMASVMTSVAISTISYDSMDNGNSFLFTLPVRRKDYATEKYFFVCGFGAVSALIVAIACGILLLVRKSEMTAGAFGVETMTCLLIVLLLADLLVPLQIKFGAEKSKIVILATVGILVLGFEIMENLDLQEIRKKLDGIDNQLVELFEKRMALCSDVAEFKIQTGKKVYDGERERQKLDSVMAMADSEFNKKGVYELFSQIMTISRKLQYGLLVRHGQALETGFTMVDDLKKEGVRIAYQGVEGSYGHGAALQYFGQDADVYHVKSMEDAMVEVEEGRADFAVLPIENSSDGAVSDNYDLLVKHNVYIVGETELAVNHALLGLPGATLEDIRQVYSHPQALMQCSQYLNSHRQWRQVSMENTAVSAKKVLEDADVTQAAVASEIAGKLYGLKVLQPSINYNKK